MGVYVFAEIEYDQADNRKWHLSVPHVLPDGSWKDVWAYSRCERISPVMPLDVSVKKIGRPVDYNFASFNIPIVSARLGQIIDEIAPLDIQRIPVNMSAVGEWEVLNVLHKVDCLDRRRSIIQYFPSDPADPEVIQYPHRAGKPRGVVKLVIDPQRVHDRHIFRIQDWTVVVIISNVLKQSFESAGVTGIHYRSVVE